MAYNKKNEFNEKLVRAADLARAISHPARIAILQTLAEKNTCICGEIVEIMPLAQSTVSQHIRELKKAGLIQGEIDGPRSCYCINHECIDEIKKLFQEFTDSIGKDRCC